MPRIAAIVLVATVAAAWSSFAKAESPPAQLGRVSTEVLDKGKPPLRLLSAYCHFAVIYRQSPVGLPIPPASAKEGLKDEALNRLLQELAWNAVVHHPLTGVKDADKETKH